MVDEPKESSWQGFLRKIKYQANEGGPNDKILGAIEDGFLGNYQDAIDTLDEVLLQSFERWDKEERAAAFAAKANMLQNLDRYEEAESAFDKAIELDSEESSFFQQKGILLLVQERYSEALICFNRAVELSKDYDEEELEEKKDYANCLECLAETYVKLGAKKDLDLALQYADEAIKLDPENPETYNVKARVYCDAPIEQYDKALENCEKGLKIDPQDTDLLSLKALIYLNMEKYDVAEKLFLELLNHNPSDNNTHYNLACVDSLLEKKQKAIDHLLVAIYLDPTNQDDMKEDPSFDNIRDSEEFKRLQSLEA